MEFKYNKFTLAFSDSETEKKFHETYRQSSLFQVRLAYVGGFILYALFGILDAALVPEQKHILWFIRYAIVCPVIAGLFLFSFSHYFKRIFQACVNIMIILSGMGIIVMIAVAPPPANYSYYAGLILVFMYGYTFIRSRFIWATITGWIIVILYEFTAIWILPTPIPILINNNFFFISANFIGMFACYFIEYSARRDFFLVQQLDEEREKVKNANIELEKRVEERTAALTKSYDKLEQEISDRVKAEDEKKELENDLKQSEKMRAVGQLAGGIAHDFNNQLSGILGYSDLLRRKLAGNEQLLKYATLIGTSVKRASDLTSQLLAFARKGKYQSVVVNLHEIIGEVINLLERTISKQIIITDSLAADPPTVMGDPSQLQNALLNIAINGTKAMPRGGILTLATGNCVLDEEYCQKNVFKVTPGPYVKVSIIDTGIGMDEETVKKIFEPFFTTRKNDGIGMGLAAVYGTIKNHEGLILVDSEPGNGTTFDVYFPCIKNPVKCTDDSDDKHIDTKVVQGTILVVDDEPLLRKMAQDTLEDVGYTVLTAEDGVEALEIYSKNQKTIDLVLLDVAMPNMNGKDTYRSLRTIDETVKVIITSGHSLEGEAQEILDMGALHFIKKPFSLDSISEIIEKALN